MKKIFTLLLLAQTCLLFSQFTPGDLDPTLWLDASDTQYLQLNADKVELWTDRSGNVNHATPPSATNQPIFVSENEGIQFDGIDDMLLSADFSYGAGNGITVFALAKSDLPSEHLKRWIVSKGKWTGGAPFGLLQNYNGLHAQMSGKQIVMEYNDQKMHILTQVIQDTVMSAAIEGISYDAIYADQNSNSHKISIGSGNEGDIADFGFQGRICEVIIFQRALTACEVSLVNGYLGHKWSEAQLSISHPFYDSYIGICKGGEILNIDENSANGTSVGSIELVSLSDQPVNAADWQIDEQSLDGAFVIDAASGEITVADGSKLDYEMISAHMLTLSVVTSDGTKTYDIMISLNDQDDGGGGKTTSLLWGENGELWDSRGRLPDFSFAGYDAGNSTIPNFTNIISVLDHGVIADDTISDVLAILDIINAAPAGSVIYFPAGKYVIDTTLVIKKSSILLKGEGENELGTVFYLPKSATEVNGTYTGSYSAGDKGHLIKFDGGYTREISAIVEEAVRGDRTITVDDPRDLKVGDVILINATGDNPVNGELWHEYHNNNSPNWSCEETWATGNGGSMFHMIEKIEGKMITLQEPLRLKLKPSWGMKIFKQTPGLVDVGIEDIRIDFIETVHTGHLDEPGYNGIQFNNSYNFWCRNITFNHCDNGIYLKGSAYGDVDNITFIGREGHHAIKIAYSANNVLTNILLNNTLPFTHSITFIHKANGNVLRNVSGTQSISLDFHRNMPFSNLICDVRSTWTHESSGAVCAGPHGGARNVYWGLYGEADAIKWGSESWGQFQSTIVSGLAVNEKFIPEKEWYEHVPNLAARDLYSTQKEYRLNKVEELIFSDNEFGDRSDWMERDPSRWIVEEVDEEKYYSLNLKVLPEMSKGKVAEYAVRDMPEPDVFEVSASVICQERIEAEMDVDFVIIVSYTDDDNYIFGRVSSNVYKSGIFSVMNGTTNIVTPGMLELTSNEKQVVKLSRQGDLLTLILNDTLIAKATVPQGVGSGKFGVGSTSSAILFDDITVSDEVSEYVIPTATTEMTELPVVTVYPNPVSDILMINIEGDEEVSYEVITVYGSMVKQGLGRQIDFSNFENGLYIIGVHFQSGNKQYLRVLKH